MNLHSRPLQNLSAHHAPRLSLNSITFLEHLRGREPHVSEQPGHSLQGSDRACARTGISGTAARKLIKPEQGDDLELPFGLAQHVVLFDA